MYTIPFLFALKFVLFTNYSEYSQISDNCVRMKIFLILCITYLTELVNKSCTKQDSFEFTEKPFYEDYFFQVNVLAVVATIYVLYFAKDHAELMGKIVLIMILSMLATAIPMNIFLKMGSKAEKFEDFYKESFGEEFPDPYISWFNDHYDLLERHSKIITAIIIPLFIQGYLVDWFLELTMENTTMIGSLAMRIAFCLPLITSAFIKSSGKTVSLWKIDILPFVGIVFQLYPAIMSIYRLENPPHPVVVHLDFRHWRYLTKTLGYFFVIRWYNLILCLSIKYNVQTYEGMSALRGYLYTYVIANLLKMSYEAYTIANLKEVLPLAFCQDYLKVLSSSAFVSRVVKYFGSCLIPLQEDYAAINVQLFSLSFIPFCHICLQFINVYYECDPHERLENLYASFVFLTIIFSMYMYTSACQEAIGSVNFTINELQPVNRNVFFPFRIGNFPLTKKPEGYMKVFLFLIIIPGGGTFFSSELKSAFIAFQNKCFTPDEQLPLVYYGDETGDYAPVAYFSYQVALFSVLSFIAILYRTSEESEVQFEGTIQKRFLAICALETVCSVMIFGKVVKYECKKTSHYYVLTGMALSNMYCTVVNRGFRIAYRIYRRWKDMTNALDNMKILDEIDLDGMTNRSCRICRNEISAGSGLLTKCTHLYHYFCIRGWIRNYSFACPECNRELPTENYVYTPPEEGDDDDDDQDDDDDDDDRGQDNLVRLAPHMIERFLNDFEKFDSKSSFYTEPSDTVVRSAEDDEGEVDEQDVEEEAEEDNEEEEE